MSPTYLSLQASDEFTALEVEHDADGHVRLRATGANPELLTTLRLTKHERRELAEALLLEGELIVRHDLRPKQAA